MLAETYIKSSNFASGEGGAVVATNYEFVVLGSSSLVLNKDSWKNNGGSVLATSGSGDTLETYSCDLSGLTTKKFNDTDNPVLKFTSDKGSVFWIKSFDPQGTSTISGTTASTNFQDDYLAMKIAEVFFASSGTTTVTAKTLAQLATAAAS